MYKILTRFPKKKCKWVLFIFLFNFIMFWCARQLHLQTDKNSASELLIPQRKRNDLKFDNQQKHRLYKKESTFLKRSSMHIFPVPRTGSEISELLPSELDPVRDRIEEQLSYIPSNYQDNNDNDVNLKSIYLYGNKMYWGMPEGQKTFIETDCKVNTCTISYDRSTGPTSDLVVFAQPSYVRSTPPWKKDRQRQIWMLSAIESPHNTIFLPKYKGLFNWTMTYRTDSVIVSPYFKYKLFDRPQQVSLTNYAKGKTKKIAWFVSNCRLVRSGRMTYAKELGKYIDIDIYGACGDKVCPRRKADDCKKMLQREYKFYLAFENSKCKDYMTEKVMTALEFNTVPIVLGAASQEYKNALPSNSYIDVEDFSSPKKLAEYLHTLDQNDELYNKYFDWKTYGYFMDTKPWCRVCALLNEPSLPAIWYDDVDQWWRPGGVCLDRKVLWWRDVKDKIHEK